MRALTILTAMTLAACGGNSAQQDARSAAPPPASAPAPAAAAPADTRPAIVVFGDSIAAGFGLDAGQSFPDLLQRDLDRRGKAFRVVNMGVSGDTTQDGAARMDLALQVKPAIVLLELGGNDGLRGLPLSATRQNLAAMIDAFQKAGATVVLAGMKLPPNYGPDYTAKFEALYRDLAAKYEVRLIPFLLEGVGGDRRYMQRDGLHPNAQGARKVEALAMQALEPLLGR